MADTSDAPNEAQLRLAVAPDVDVSGLSRTLAAVRRRGAVAPALILDSRPATDKQVTIAKTLGLDVSGQSVSVARELIDADLTPRNLAALERLALRPGDQIVVQGGSVPETVASVGRNNKIFLKGGGGESVWTLEVGKVVQRATFHAVAAAPLGCHAACAGKPRASRGAASRRRWLAYRDGRPMKTAKKKAEPTSKAKKQVKMTLLDVYRACLENAEKLLTEAQLLLDAGHHERSFVLGYTAYEEIGKSQIVADFFNDVVSEEEFWAAFRDHRLKAAYVRRVVALSVKNMQDATIEYDPKTMDPHFKVRMDALYVDCTRDLRPLVPSVAVSPKMARDAINAARQELQYIAFAERLNQRIGSKGMFK